MAAAVCLRRYGLLPSAYLALSTHERAFLIACAELDKEKFGADNVGHTI